ncbi:ribosomal RNA small subunit methyltransferase, mitochondrial isoform X2 [Aristolochia californica]|uniref:ribosomal RNA small subunit methyltransferase, mitochondrial isoform X2 n=1 Tax=Aristolochia californica TaxID=171875 RepID=UPI0035DCEBC7
MICRAKSLTFSCSRGFRWNTLLSYSRGANRFAAVEDEDSGRKRTEEKDGGRVYLHKSRGQHILTNPRILDSIVRKAEIRPTDTILEIGPGTGNLTLKLLEAANKVVAVEIDKRMVEILHNRVTDCKLDDRLTVISQDALKTQFPQFDLCIANIPYGISSPLVVKLLFGGHSFRSATLLLQKEFARRLLAKPGDSEYNRLAVNVQLVATVEFVMDVSKRDFVPCPKVDSSVVKIRPKSEIPDVDLEEWRAFSRTCFSKKNKTLGAIFKLKRKVQELSRRLCNEPPGARREINNAYDGEDEGDDEGEGDEDCGDFMDTGSLKEKIVAILRAGGFESKRPSKLSVEEMLHLLSLFNQAGIYFHTHR